jgi:hypothetical protein
MQAKQITVVGKIITTYIKNDNTELNDGTRYDGQNYWLQYEQQVNETTAVTLISKEAIWKSTFPTAFKLQTLQATTVGIIPASFSSVRPDIRTSTVASLMNALGGGDPVHVPMPLLCEWTENFSPSLAVGSGSFGEVFQACFSNSDRHCTSRGVACVMSRIAMSFLTLVNSRKAFSTSL